MDSRSTILGTIDRRIVNLGEELHAAVRASDHDLAKKLIADGAPLDATDDCGYTHLHVAVSTEDVEMVQLLVAEGAEMDALDNSKATPLMDAARLGRDAVAEALLDAGADASLRWYNSTALGLASENGHVVVLSVFIRHGIDVNDANEVGETALHQAARGNKQDAIDVLVAAGADTEARSINEQTPLHTASEIGGFKAVVALLKHGANINAQDIFELSPLHQAASLAGTRGAVEMVDLLLRRGADETATDRFGKNLADVTGKRCLNIEEVGGVARVRKLLANAPVAREAWRRRGLLVACRARPQTVLLTTNTQPAGDWMDLMGRVLALREEGLFRTIVGYL